MKTDGDPLARKSQADRLIERAADELHDLLVEAAAELRPFPPFPGAYFTCAIECEPDSGANADYGCIVVKEDGELYELQVGIDRTSMEMGSTDPVALRSEETRPVRLHPRDYIVYAYNGLVAVTEKLMEQRETQRR